MFLRLTATFLFFGYACAQPPAEYRDAAAAVSFQLPSGWTAGPATHPGEGETNVQFRDPQHQGLAAFYYKLLPGNTSLTADQIRAALRAGVDAKIAQRKKEGIKTYHLSLDRCESRAVAGHAALICDAEYVQREKAMVEHLVWIRTSRTSALLFARSPAPEADDFRRRLEPLLASLHIR
jgi:hypothetical protein